MELLNRENLMSAPNPLYLDVAATNEECFRLYTSFVMAERPYDKALEQMILGRRRVV